MKRIICLITVALLISSTAFAWVNDSSKVNFSTYVADNSSGTVYSVTYASKSVIVPGKSHILGYKIIALDGSKSSEFVAALHDSEVTDIYLDESMIDESETNITNNTGVWFPYPKSIKTQLCIRQGPNTRVIVYYDPK